MLNTSLEINSYLNSNSVKAFPFVSGEWNYNLIYPTFATFSSLGNGFDTSKYLTTTNWTKSSDKISIDTTTKGYISDVFKDSTAIQLSLTPSSTNGKPDLVDYTNFSGSAKINFTLPASVNKSYKFVYYVKSMTDDIINLVTQVDSTDNIYLKGTSFVAVDNINWQKVEAKSGLRSTDGTYSSINLTLDMTNTTLNSSSAWGIIVSQVKVYEITGFDYANGNLWNTDNVFTYFRPGESYVTSGNSSVSEVQRTATISGNWNNALPISPVVYSPRVLFRPSTSNPLYKNGVLSSFSPYKYFVSEKPTLTNLVQSSTSIGAAYEELLAVNKIVLKFNLSQSKPDNIVVNLYNEVKSSSNPVATVNIGKDSITDSGECVLYWNGKTFTTTKWSWDPISKSNMPTIDDSGNITMYVGGSKIDGYIYVTKINVTQMSSTSVTNYNVDNPINSDTDLELRRLQVVEISPRLELDMTPYVLTVDIKKEIDSNNTPLPISSMSSNSAIIEFSNIPLSGPSNTPRSVFSTNANSPAYITPLAGMLLKNTKFYTYFYLPDKSNALIPAGVYYADTWDNQDIKKTTVNCFDIMKFLQTVSVSDYVSANQDLFTVFTNLMDFAGFTDYNYDQLKSLFTDNEQLLTSSFFFADAASKTVYKILQEAFLAYQVGAWIDEYGIMQFKNLKQIVTNNASVFNVNDSNIVNDTYNETIKTKIGKILMRYRGPQIKRSVGLSDANKTTSILQIAPDIIWKQDAEDVVPFTMLSNSINSYSQNFYETDPGGMQSLFFGNTINHSGYVMIENEIMSSGNVELSLDALDSNGNNITSQGTLIFPANQDELNSQIALLSNNTSAAQITQTPTGRFVNVERGLFGTKASNHKIMQTSDDYAAKFNTMIMPVNSGTTKTGSNFGIKNNKIQVLTQGNSTKTMVSAKINDAGYSTYSAKFRIPTAPTNAYAGIFFGAGSGTTYFVEIKTNGIDSPYKSYYLSMYSVDSSGTTKQLIKAIDVTNYLHADFDNEPMDVLYDAEFAYVLNLKFVNVPGKRVVSVNNYKYFLDGKVNSLGKEIRPSYWLSSSIPASVPSGFSGSAFGFFASTDSSTTSAFDLAEIYATESPIFETVDYYYQTREFLNAIVQNINVNENSFLVQVRPEIRGINYYDVQLALTPSLGAEFFKSYYSFYYYPDGNTNATQQFMTVKENALSYSNIASTGYRAKFAIANNSRHAVFTSTGTTSTKIATANLLVASREMITLTPQLTLEKIINKQNVNEVVEIQTDWIQSKRSAESIIKTVASASDAFSKDISIEIYGNPLIQVGDVINVTYGLKNIQSIIFFVKSVDQVYSDGLKTILILNQITYNGVNRNNLGIVFPYPSNAGNGPAITKITPSSGSAGDTVTIIGFGIGSDASVLFGKNIATIQSITVSTDAKPEGSIVVTVPTPLKNGPVDVSVISSGLTSTAFGGFTYALASKNIQTISNLTASATSMNTATSTYNGTATWSVSNTAGLLYNSYNWQLSGIGKAIDKQGAGSNISDLPTGTHTLSLSQLIPGDTYTLTITPLYTANGIVTAGAAQSTTFTVGDSTIQPVSTSGASGTILSNVGWANINSSSNTGQITFSMTKDSVTQPAIAGYTVYVSSAGSPYFLSALALGFADLPGGVTADWNTLGKVVDGSVTWGGTLAPYISNSQIIKNGTGTFTDPNGSQVLAGGGIGISEGTAIINSPYGMYGTLNVSVTQASQGALGTVAGAKYTSNTIVYGNFHGTPPSDYVWSPTPANIVPSDSQSLPGVTQISNQENVVATDIPLSGSTYTVTTAGTYDTTRQYNIYVIPYDITGAKLIASNTVSLNPTSGGTGSGGVTLSNASNPIVALVVTGGVEVSWSISASTTQKYSTYNISMSDSNGHNISDVITSNTAGTSWTDGAGNVVSTDGITFKYTRYANYVLFTGGSTLTGSITGSGTNSSGVAISSNTAKINYTIPAPTTLPNVAGLIISISQVGTERFSWTNVTLPSGSPSTNYDYELYNGTNETGTLIASAYSTTVNSITTNYTFPPSIPLFFRLRVTPVSGQYTSSWSTFAIGTTGIVVAGGTTGSTTPAAQFTATGSPGSSNGVISVSWTNPPTGTSYFKATASGSTLTSPATQTVQYPSSSCSWNGAVANKTYTIDVNAYTSTGAILGSSSTTVIAPGGLVTYYTGTSICNLFNSKYSTGPSVSGPNSATTMPSDTQSSISGIRTVTVYRSDSASALAAAAQADCLPASPTPTPTPVTPTPTPTPVVPTCEMTIKNVGSSVCRSKLAQYNVCTNPDGTIASSTFIYCISESQ